MRLIDADVFKENMDFICDAGGWLEPVTKAVREFVKKHIDAQTTVHPEPHWIPCSERLPDVGAILLSDGNEIVIGEYYGDNTWKVDGCDYDPILEEIAWQPLPEKFKEEGGEE